MDQMSGTHPSSMKKLDHFLLAGIFIQHVGEVNVSLCLNSFYVSPC